MSAPRSCSSHFRLIVCIASVLLLAAACGSKTNTDAVPKLKLERVNTATANPFMGNLGTDVVGVTPPAESSGKIYGDSPGLYGGTQNLAACDTSKMVSFLEDNPEKGAAWAKTLGIKQSDIRTYIGTLTPVILRTNTAVTNHGFANGSATTVPAVLEAGTAVLVDPQGMPVAKCYCGNPLTPPPSKFTSPGSPPTIIVPGCVDGPERAVPCDIPSDTTTPTPTTTPTTACVDGPERAVPCDIPPDTTTPTPTCVDGPERAVPCDVPGSTTTTFVLCDPDAYASPSTSPKCFLRPSGTSGASDSSLPAGYRVPPWRSVPSGNQTTTVAPTASSGPAAASSTRYYDGTSSAAKCTGAFEQDLGDTPITVRRQGDQVYIGTNELTGTVQANGRVSFLSTYYIDGDPPGTQNGELQVEGQFVQGRFTANIRSSTAGVDGYCDRSISAEESTVYEGTAVGSGMCAGVESPVIVRQTNASISFEVAGALLASGPIGSNEGGVAVFDFTVPGASGGGVSSSVQIAGRVKYPLPDSADQLRRVSATSTVTVVGGPAGADCAYLINAVEQVR